MATPSISAPPGPSGSGVPEYIHNHPLATGKPKIGILSILLTVAVVVLAGWSFNGTQFNPVQVVQELPSMATFIRKLFPPQWGFFLNQDRTIIPTIETIQLAVAGTIVAVLLALPISLFAARNLAPTWLYSIIRAVLNVFRSIPELVWALIFVSAVGLGTFPGTLAIIAGSVGSLAKVFAEQIEAIDPRPVEATEAVGATQVQQISFAVLPQALPNMMSYILLYGEHNVRASFIVGAVGGGGLGQVMTEELNLFKYNQFTVHLIIIITLVTVVDRLSAYVRKRLV